LISRKGLYVLAVTIVFILVVGKGVLVGKGIINGTTSYSDKESDDSSLYSLVVKNEECIIEIPKDITEIFKEENIEISEEQRDKYSEGMLDYPRYSRISEDSRGGNVVRKEIQTIRVFTEDGEENIVLSDISPEKAAEAIDEYMEVRKAPLSGYGDVFIRVADKYGHDWRLLPAISLRESTGGKHLFRSFNPFGWGKSSFDGFEEAIETVGRHLAGLEPRTAGYYKDRTIRQKLRKYNSVVEKYPEEVFAIMRDIERGTRD
jgi:hypothetical protein